MSIHEARMAVVLYFLYFLCFLYLTFLVAITLPGATIYVSKKAAYSLFSASHLFDHPVGVCYVPEVDRFLFLTEGLHHSPALRCFYS
jgi:hypothetical protein